MRKDEGVGGDGQRIEQIVWMLFLKILDDQEVTLELIDDNYKSPIPTEYRWRTWAKNSEGLTGDELVKFLGEKLFPTLKTLPPVSERARLVRDAFSDTYNYMRSGTLIRQMINEINAIDFNNTDDRHMLGDIYEKILKDLQNAGNYGEFYTPRPLTKFVVEMVDPKIGEKVLDPAAGTGGFLANTIEYLRKTAKTKKDEEKIATSVSGVELKQLPHLLSITNFILHGVETPTTLSRGDMLSKPLIEYSQSDKVDVIFANPPFGGAVKDGTENNFPSKYRTKATEQLFLVLFIHLLKVGGRAGVVFPDGTLFADGVGASIREHLLTECNVHTIVRLPQGVFNPYAGVNTNLVFFEKGQPTKEVWYYEMQLPAGLKQYTKGKPITDSEFDAVKNWWKDRKENENAWRVGIEDIKAKNWNLDFKNPHQKEVEKELSSKELVERILEREEEIKKLLENI